MYTNFDDPNGVASPRGNTVQNYRQRKKLEHQLTSDFYTKDEPESIDADRAANPKEALVVGSSVALNLHNKRILFKGSFQSSIKNEDAAGEKVDFDSLANKYDLTQSEIDQVKPFVDLMDKTGFLTLTQGLSPIPSFAMQFETHLRYFGHSLKATYKRIDTEFTSPGNPYLRKDIAGIFISDNVRLLQNQVLLNFQMLRIFKIGS